MFVVAKYQNNMSLTRNFIVNLLRDGRKSCWARSVRSLSTEAPENADKTPKRGGYAKAFDKFENLAQDPLEQPQTFAALLRNSKFIDLGDPEGKIVTGKIVHVIDDDLYIDFGWKFNCVCPIPKKNAANYVRGARVRIMIKDLELSSKFLGYNRDLTLLEADCTLLGLSQDRSKST